MDSFGPIQSLQTLIRHHTYYNKPTLPLQIPGTLLSGKAVSLLTHILDFDRNFDQNISESSPSCMERMDVNSAGGPSISDWFSELKLPALSSMLTTILYQCIESLADPMWELRRMAAQVLPCVAEVLRWYDVELVVDQCNMHLTGHMTSVLEYGLMLTAKYTMQHAASLGHFQQRFSSVHQNSTSNEKVIEQIVATIHRHVYSWSSAAINALRRPTIDKITVIAMEILMLDHAHFNSDVTRLPESLVAIYNVLANVYSRANPGVLLATELTGMASFVDMTVIPPDGFLSCGIKTDSGRQLWLGQIEKSILSDLQHVLVSFCHSSLHVEALFLFPLLTSYIRKYSNDDTLPSLLIDSVSGLIATLERTQKQCDFATVQPFLTHIVFSLNGLADLIVLKTVDVSTLKLILDLYRRLICLTKPTESLLMCLLHAISSRLATVSVCGVKNLPKTNTNQADYADLTLLSNDIPIVTSDDGKIHSSDEDDLLERSIDNADIQLLSVSGNSGTSASPLSLSFVATSSKLARTITSQPRQASTHTLSSDSESDWDEWSDTEQEHPSEICEILSDFLRRLSDDTITEGSSTLLTSCIMHLPEKERHQLDSIMSRP
jgi:hypothetical protein